MKRRTFFNLLSASPLIPLIPINKKECKVYKIEDFTISLNGERIDNSGIFKDGFIQLENKFLHASELKNKLYKNNVRKDKLIPVIMHEVGNDNKRS